VVERAPAREVHIIPYNLSAHKSQVVRVFLATHLNVYFPLKPTYSSRLNQVEIWFPKVERDVIARGFHTSVKDLARKLHRYINAYSANAKPIRSRYSDPTRRIRRNIVAATSH
jgi:transposase